MVHSKCGRNHKFNKGKIIEAEVNKKGSKALNKVKK